jgi:hypothetical protein
MFKVQAVTVIIMSCGISITAKTIRGTQPQLYGEDAGFLSGGSREKLLEALQVKSMHHRHRYHKNSKVDHCEYSDWGAWSKCSVSCGRGDRVRSKSLLVNSIHGGEECDALKTARGTCRKAGCPSYVPSSTNDKVDAFEDATEIASNPRQCGQKELEACKSLVLHGPKCVDCVQGVSPACTTKQMDVMCWAASDSTAYDDAFDAAVKLDGKGR